LLHDTCKLVLHSAIYRAVNLSLSRFCCLFLQLVAPRIRFSD